MLKVILFSILTCVVFSVNAQVQTQVIGDSVFIHSNTGKGELILRNSTDTVKGFLFNKGAGRTEFRRVLVKVDDTTYVLGADTLHIYNTGSANAWSLTGNAGTGSSNFIGTTDNRPLIIKSFGGVNSGFTGGGYSVAFGYDTYTYDTASLYSYSDNVAFGANALKSLNRSSNLTNAGNVAVGRSALGRSKWGWANIAVGPYSLYGTPSSNNTFKGNVAIGFQSLTGLQSGVENTSLGDSSLRQITTGNYNIGIGTNAGKGITSSSNTFYISDSTYHMKYKLDSAAGTAPSIIGKDASGFWHTYQNPLAGGLPATNLGNGVATAFEAPILNSNGTGVSLPLATIATAGLMSAADKQKLDKLSGSGISQQALDDSTASAKAFSWNLTGNAGTGSSNFIGTTDNSPLSFRIHNIASGKIGTTSDYNTSFGYSSLPSSTGIKNTGLGSFAMLNNSTGYNNTAIGYSALYKNTSGHDNVALGWTTLTWDSSGIGNTAIGETAMGQLGPQITHKGGSYNTALGYRSLVDNWDNNYNIGLGYLAGNNSTSSNTFYISDSTRHMHYQLDSASGQAPTIIGKDANGFWHTYQNPLAGGGTNIILTTTGSSGPASLAGNALNIPEYSSPIATTSTVGLVSVGQGLVIDSAGQLSTSTSLLKHGSVPYAGPAGTLIQDTTGLVYDGNNLQVGHSNFYSTTGLSLNGGRGYLGASGFGLTIKTNGGEPMDASKSISFYNSSTRYGVMSMRSVSDSTLRFLTDMEIVPSSTNTYNLGSSAKQWDTVFAKQLYVDGVLVGGGSGFILTTTGTSGPATLTGNTLNVPDYSAGSSGTIPTLDSVVHQSNTTTKDILINGITVGKGNGDYNTLVGKNALNSNNSATDNVAFGTNSLYSLTSGYGNSTFGNYTFSGLTSGDENLAAGYFAGVLFQSGSRNIFLGSYAGTRVYNGDNNIVIGTNACNGPFSATGSKNIYIGTVNSNSLMGSATANGSRNITIGDSIMNFNNSANNQLNIGNLIFGKNLDGIGRTISTGNIGIGISNPLEKLDVAGNIKASGTVSLPNSSGTATLVSGTITVNTTYVKTGSRIYISVNTPGGTQGFLSAPSGSIVNGVSFTINSTSATDSSSINWLIVN